MSLTSYRAAPPRDRISGREHARRALVRFGGDLLSHVLGRSTIGAAALNGRVRDGIGCFARANATKPAGRTGDIVPAPRDAVVLRRPGPSDVLLHDPSGRPTSGLRSGRGSRLLPDRIQASRAISTGQLNALPRLHLRPIDVVVCHGPQGRPGFEGGFPLRCLQRLSCPHIATLHCRWHDNRSTSGAFTPVLSY